MTFGSRVNFAIAYFQNWIIQISFLLLINLVKIMKISHKFNSKYILNNFIDYEKRMVDRMIDKGIILFTKKSNIMYQEHTPKNNKHNGKKILFLGGRNGYNSNREFAEMLCNHIGISVISFQYDGYYKSGTSTHLDEKSYFRTIEDIYNLISIDSDVYCVGYSMGCYGAHYINNKNKLFLISPFYSLQRTLRDVIKIPGFNLNDLLSTKYTNKIIIHSFYQDLINPHYHLTDNFKNDNIKIHKHHGNHITGISDFLLNDIEDYIIEN